MCHRNRFSNACQVGGVYATEWEEITAYYIQVDTLDEVQETHEINGGAYNNIDGVTITNTVALEQTE